MTEQTQPTDALLPCPFCGAAAHFEMDEGRWEWVECESCEMQGNRSASLMDDCKPKLAEEWNRRTPPAVAPWRSAVLDLIDDCPGLTLEQDHWLSRRVKELDFATTPQPTQAQAGAVVITTDLDTGQCVAVTRQDDEGRVLSVIWQAPEAQAGAVPLTADELKEPRNGKHWRVEWWNESCRMMLPTNKRIDSFQSYKNGTLMFTIKEAKGADHG